MDPTVPFLAWPWLGTGPHVVIVVIILVLAWRQGSTDGTRGRLVLGSLAEQMLLTGGDVCLPGEA